MMQVKIYKLGLFLLFLICPQGEASTSVNDPGDIAILALSLSKEIYPDVNVSSYSAKIDSIVRQVKWLTKNSRDPDFRIRCLNTVIFVNEGFQAIRSSSFNRSRDAYSLNHLLDTKVGNCFSLPLLYVILGQRLQWPIYFVDVPDHSFVRYVDPSLKEQNIEATSGGGYVSNRKYQHDFRIGDKGIKEGTYLRTMTHWELIGHLLTINAVSFGQTGDLAKAIAYLELATRFNPYLVGAWANLAEANRMLARKEKSSKAQKYIEVAEVYSRKLDELGFVHPKDVPQFKPNGRSIK